MELSKNLLTNHTNSPEGLQSSKKPKGIHISSELSLLELMDGCSVEQDVQQQILENSNGFENDPPLFIAWRDCVRHFVGAIANLPGDAPAPPFALPIPMTVESFERALLDHVRAGVGEAPLGNFCLHRTLGQYGLSIRNLSLLADNAWFVAVIQAAAPTVVVPLGEWFTAETEDNVIKAVGCEPNQRAQLWA